MTGEVDGVVVAGHGVASGRKRDPRFPAGTLALQLPVFADRGVDLARFHRGTINVDVSPYRLDPIAPGVTLRAVRWHPTEPVEDFSFFDCLLVRSGRSFEACLYWPHPETKPEHHQPGTVVEVMAPMIDGLRHGDSVRVAVAAGQAVFIR